MRKFWLAFAMAFYASSWLCAGGYVVGHPWRTDYDGAMTDAAKANQSVLVDCGFQTCLYCRKLNVAMAKEPALMNIVPVKLDRDEDTDLVQQLQVHVYPTLLLINSKTGMVLQRAEGYEYSLALYKSLEQSPEMTPIADSVTVSDCPPGCIPIPKVCRAKNQGEGVCCWCSIRTVCNYLHVPGTDGLIVARVKGTHWGNPQLMRSELVQRQIAYHQERQTSKEHLKAWLDAGIPVCIDVWDHAHMCVCVGIPDNSHLWIVGNNDLTYQKIPMEWWSGWAVFVEPPKGTACRFLDRLRNRRHQQPQPDNSKPDNQPEPDKSKPDDSYQPPPKPEPKPEPEPLPAPKPTPAPEPSAPPAWAQQIQISINNANDGIKGVTDILKNHEARLKSLETKPAVPPVSPSKWEWQPK